MNELDQTTLKEKQNNMVTKMDSIKHYLSHINSILRDLDIPNSNAYDILNNVSNLNSITNSKNDDFNSPRELIPNNHNRISLSNTYNNIIEEAEQENESDHDNNILADENFTIDIHHSDNANTNNNHTSQNQAGTSPRYILFEEKLNKTDSNTRTLDQSSMMNVNIVEKKNSRLPSDSDDIGILSQVLSKHQLNEINYEINDYPKCAILLTKELKSKNNVQDLNIKNRILLIKEYNIAMTNINFLKEFGYAKNELHNENNEPLSIDILLNDEYKQSLQDQLEIKMGEGQTEPIIAELKSKDNSVQAQSIKAEPLKIDDKIQGVLVQIDKSSVLTKQQSLNPANSYQLIQSSIMFMVILFLMFQVPYEIPFGDDDTMSIDKGMEWPIIALFTIDIFLNFFIAYEEADDEWEQRLEYIFHNQVTGQFLLDIISTIPYDMLLDSVSQNANFLKSLKLSKFVRIIKLLRLSKSFSILNAKAIKNNQVGKTLQEFQKDNQGLFELFGQNLLILLFAHFQTCLQYFTKVSAFSIDNEDWLNEYYGISDSNPVTKNYSNFNVYTIMLMENVKTALGLSVIRPQQAGEIFLTMAWMFIGLSLFGQGIGNISSQINHANKLTIQQNETLQFFNELCVENDVNVNMYKQLIDDVNNQFANQNDTMFQEYAKCLSKPVFVKFETVLMEKFVNSFPLFQNMPLSVVRNLKNVARFRQDTVDIDKGSIVDKALFLTKGQLKVYNSDMQLINEQKQGEIFGISYFKKFINTKWNIDIDQIFGGAKGGSDLQKMSINNFNMKRNSSIYKLRENSDLFSSTVGNEDQEDSFEIKQNNNLVASDGIMYFEISQKNLEVFLMNDSSHFYTLWKHNAKSYETITLAEKKASANYTRKFNSNPIPGFIILENGQIQDVNPAMLENWKFSQELIGSNLYDYMYILSQLNGWTEVKSPNEINLSNEYQLRSNDEVILKFKIESKNFRLLTRKNEAFENNKVDSNYFNLVKSMLKTQFLQLNIDDGENTNPFEKPINSKTNKKFNIRYNKGK